MYLISFSFRLRGSFVHARTQAPIIEALIILHPKFELLLNKALERTKNRRDGLI